MAYIDRFNKGATVPIDAINLSNTFCAFIRLLKLVAESYDCDVEPYKNIIKESKLSNCYNTDAFKDPAARFLLNQTKYELAFHVTSLREKCIVKFAEKLAKFEPSNPQPTSPSSPSFLPIAARPKQ